MLKFLPQTSTVYKTGIFMNNILFIQVLVHGEANEMSRLKAALNREYEDDSETSINIHNPKNTESVQLYFK